jgi:lysozyme
MNKPKVIMSSRAAKYIAAISASGAIIGASMMIKDGEGREYRPYIDPVGVLTVCDGVTGADVIRGKTYTDKECDALLIKHTKIAEAAVNRQVKVPINDFIKSSLIDFTYNLGEGNLASSTLIKKLNAKDYEGACYELIRWNKGLVKGRKVELKGLTTRRNDEMAVCLHG